MLIKNTLNLKNLGIFWKHLQNTFNPFQANVPFLYPLKTSENLWFSEVFRGYRKGTLAWNGLIEQHFSIIEKKSKKIWASIFFSQKIFGGGIVSMTQLTFTCSKPTTETLKKAWNMIFKVNNKHSSVFIVNFEHISNLFLVFLFMALNK